MSGLWKMYQCTLIKHPVVMQAVQTGMLMGVGDVMSQTLVEKKKLKNVELYRTLKFSSVGFFYAGPVLRNWFGFLNNYIGSQGTTVVLKKVAVDQILFAPFFIGSLLIVIGFAQGKNKDENIKRFKEDYPDVIFNNYKVWPWVQLTNFYFVPLNYQVLLNQFVAVFWNTYISWKTNVTAAKKK